MKILAVLICALLFASNTLLLHAREVNFWAARRAVIPTSSVIPGGLRHPGEGRDPGLKPFLKSTNGLDSGLRRNDGVIIHIHDIHQNLEAQTHIAQKIRTLIENNEVDLIALEGAFGEMDFKKWQNFENQEAVQKTADYLLREGKITGPVHTLLRHPGEGRDPVVVGVDDKSLYEANIDAYKKSVNFQFSIFNQFSGLIDQLKAKKREVFNRDLFGFDMKVEEYRSGKIELGEYARLFVGADLRVRPKATPKKLRRGGSNEGRHGGLPLRNIDLFLTALNLEETLDFDRVEHDRARLLRKLLSRLNNKETETLMRKSAAFQAGHLTQTQFYSFFKETCTAADVSLTSYPELNAYVRYVLLSDGIDADELTREIRALEKETYSALVETESERALIEESRRLYLKSKLVKFELTPEEWKDYKTTVPSNPRAFVPSFEAFYRYAELRDKAMADNLFAAMKKYKAKRVVLVTGGFHAGGIRKEIDQKVLIEKFIPKISKHEDQYLTAFTQQKTPLEKLFTAEKLFVSPPPRPDPRHISLLIASVTEWIKKGTFFSSLHKLEPQWARSLNLTVKRKAGQLHLLLKQFVMKIHFDHRNQITSVHFVPLIGVAAWPRFFVLGTVAIISVFFVINWILTQRERREKIMAYINSPGLAVPVIDSPKDFDFALDLLEDNRYKGHWPKIFEILVSGTEQNGDLLRRRHLPRLIRFSSIISQNPFPELLFDTAGIEGGLKWIVDRIVPRLYLIDRQILKTLLVHSPTSEFAAKLIERLIPYLSRNQRIDFLAFVLTYLAKSYDASSPNVKKSIKEFRARFVPEPMSKPNIMALAMASTDDYDLKKFTSVIKELNRIGAALLSSFPAKGFPSNFFDDYYYSFIDASVGLLFQDGTGRWNETRELLNHAFDLKEIPLVIDAKGRVHRLKKEPFNGDATSLSLINSMIYGSRDLYEIVKQLGKPFWHEAVIARNSETGVVEHAIGKVLYDPESVNIQAQLLEVPREQILKKGIYHEYIELIREAPGFELVVRRVLTNLRRQLKETLYKENKMPLPVFFHQFAREFHVENAYQIAVEAEQAYEMEDRFLWHLVASVYSDAFTGLHVADNLASGKFGVARRVTEVVLNKEMVTYRGTSLSLHDLLSRNPHHPVFETAQDLATERLKDVLFGRHIQFQGMGKLGLGYSSLLTNQEAKTRIRKDTRDKIEVFVRRQKDVLNANARNERRDQAKYDDPFPYGDAENAKEKPALKVLRRRYPAKPIRLAIFDFDRTQTHGYPQHVQTLALLHIFLNKDRSEEFVFSPQEFRAHQREALLNMFVENVTSINKRTERSLLAQPEGKKGNVTWVALKAGYRARVEKKIDELYKSDPQFSEALLEHKVERIKQYVEQRFLATFKDASLTYFRGRIWHHMEKQMGQKNANNIRKIETSIFTDVRDSDSFRRVRQIRKISGKYNESEEADREDNHWLRQQVYDYMNGPEGEVHSGKDVLTPGVRELFKELTQQGVRVITMSSASEARILPRYEKTYKMADVFRRPDGTWNVWGREKIDALPPEELAQVNRDNIKETLITMVLKEFDVDPSQVAVFDDMPEGIIAANKVGATSVGVVFSKTDEVALLTEEDESAADMILERGYGSKYIRNRLYLEFGLKPDYALRKSVTLHSFSFLGGLIGIFFVLGLLFWKLNSFFQKKELTNNSVSIEVMDFLYNKGLEISKSVGDFLKGNKDIRPYFGEVVEASLKKDKSTLVEADEQAAFMVTKELLESFPDHYVRVEEDLEKVSSVLHEQNEKNRNSNYEWVVDPLDGSRFYSEDQHTYAFQMMLLNKKTGLPVVSYVVFPELKLTLSMRQDEQGIFVNGGQRLNIQYKKLPTNPKRMTVVAHHNRKTDHPHLEKLKGGPYKKIVEGGPAGYLMAGVIARILGLDWSEEPGPVDVYDSLGPAPWDALPAGALLWKLGAPVLAHGSGEDLFPYFAKKKEKYVPVIFGTSKKGVTDYRNRMGLNKGEKKKAILRGFEELALSGLFVSGFSVVLNKTVGLEPVVGLLLGSGLSLLVATIVHFKTVTKFNYGKLMRGPPTSKDRIALFIFFSLTRLLYFSLLTIADLHVVLAVFIMIFVHGVLYNGFIAPAFGLPLGMIPERETESVAREIQRLQKGGSLQLEKVFGEKLDVVVLPSNLSGEQLQDSLGSVFKKKKGKVLFLVEAGEGKTKENLEVLFQQNRFMVPVTVEIDRYGVVRKGTVILGSLDTFLEQEGHGPASHVRLWHEFLRDTNLGWRSRLRSALFTLIGGEEELSFAFKALRQMDRLYKQVKSQA